MEEGKDGEKYSKSSGGDAWLVNPSGKSARGGALLRIEVYLFAMSDEKENILITYLKNLTAHLNYA